MTATMIKLVPCVWDLLRLAFRGRVGPFSRGPLCVPRKLSQPAASQLGPHLRRGREGTRQGCNRGLRSSAAGRPAPPLSQAFRSALGPASGGLVASPDVGAGARRSRRGDHDGDGHGATVSETWPRARSAVLA